MPCGSRSGAVFDLILRGGTLIHADGACRADLAIQGGAIAALLPPGTQAEVRRTLDAHGKLLLPGLVDAHAHLREPGATHKEDFGSATRAALAGGVTTVLDMPTDDPWTVTPEDFTAKRALAERRIHVDVGLQVALGPQSPAALRALVAAGAVSFEIFTADVPPAFLHADAACVEAAMRRVAEAGGTVCVSPGDQSLLLARLAALAPGRSSPTDFAATRPPLAEAMGIARALVAAAGIGCAVHVRQINAAAGLAVWRRLRDIADASVETTPQNLIFTVADYERPDGVMLKASPPLRAHADRAALRAALAEGVIDVVATDHAPHLPAEKYAAAADFANVPGGLPGLQTLLPAMLRLVADGVLSLPGLVAACATNPARRFGLAAKGRLAPGADADVLVLDPRGTWTVTDADQHSKAEATPFAGLSVPFALERVLLRGAEVLTPDGAIAPPRGRVLGPA